MKRLAKNSLPIRNRNLKSKRGNRGIQGGKKPISEAIRAWEEYLNVSEAGEERSLAEGTLNNLRQDEAKLLRLETQLTNEFKAKRYESCIGLIRQIREIQECNIQYSDILKKIKVITDLSKEYNRLSEIKQSYKVEGWDSDLSSLAHKIELIEKSETFEKAMQEISKLDKLQSQLKEEEDKAFKAKIGGVVFYLIICIIALIIGGVGAKFIFMPILSALREVFR